MNVSFPSRTGKKQSWVREGFRYRLQGSMQRRAAIGKKKKPIYKPRIFIAVQSILRIPSLFCPFPASVPYGVHNRPETQKLRTATFVPESSKFKLSERKVKFVYAESWVGCAKG